MATAISHGPARVDATDTRQASNTPTIARRCGRISSPSNRRESSCSCGRPVIGSASAAMIAVAVSAGSVPCQS